MKLKLFYFAILLCCSIGNLAGQEFASEFQAANCDSKIHFHGHAKSIREIFPEECPHPLSGTSIVKYMTGVLKDAPKSSEPEDVPAIKEPEKMCSLFTFPVGSSYSCAEPLGSACPCGHYIDVDITTCSDKSRILLTAEDGTKWCHKLKPEPEPERKR